MPSRKQNIQSVLRNEKRKKPSGPDFMVQSVKVDGKPTSTVTGTNGKRPSGGVTPNATPKRQPVHPGDARRRAKWANLLGYNPNKQVGPGGATTKIGFQMPTWKQIKADPRYEAGKFHPKVGSPKYEQREQRQKMRSQFAGRKVGQPAAPGKSIKVPNAPGSGHDLRSSARRSSILGIVKKAKDDNRFKKPPRNQFKGR